MPFDLPYGTLLSYNPRGGGDLGAKSRRVCGSIKRPVPEVISKAFEYLQKPVSRDLREFLGADAVLVPVPRSSPLVDGAAWPSKVIADLLCHEGFGSEVLPCIQRVHAVKKSSSSEGRDRPDVETHYQSFSVSTEIFLFPPQTIILIDDVLTQGRTTVACARRIQDAFPESEVKVFAVVRTLGFRDIERIVDPAVSHIKYHASGKTFREGPEE